MEKRIYYYDTDAGGVVYYGRYLNYLEEGRTELLERLGLSVDDFSRRGLLYAVRKLQIQYRSPARYGDVVVCDAALTKVSAAQLFFDQTIRQRETGVVVLTAEVVLACLNCQFKPAPIPADLRDRLPVAS